MPGLLHTLRFRLDHRWASRHMSDYLDGDLAGSGPRRLEHHVTECEECRGLLAALRRMVEALQAAPSPVEQADVSGLTAAVRTRLTDTRPSDTRLTDTRPSDAR
jgi:anti-sigma factor RsiW